jgi:hypothetical protein
MGHYHVEEQDTGRSLESDTLGAELILQELRGAGLAFDPTIVRAALTLKLPFLRMILSRFAPTTIFRAGMVFKPLTTHTQIRCRHSRIPFIQQ